MPRRVSKLPRRFYQKPADQLGRDLIGKFLVHHAAGLVAAGRIVETEAYVGPHDLACHASKGLTNRTRVMFGPPGHAYVYLIYGISKMFNIVCEREGYPAAVLIRALEPAEGVARETDGPGKLTRALGITLADNGCDLLGDELWLEDRGGEPAQIVTTPRIGIDYAGEWVSAPLRFVDAGSQWLSKRVPGSPRRTRVV